MAQQRERAALLARGGGVGGRLGYRLGRLGNFSKRNPTMVAGIAIVVFFGLVALFADLLWTRDPLDIDAHARFVEPFDTDREGIRHWFGTDQIGRDVWSRVIFGTRISLFVAFAVAAITMIAASFIGLIAGYYRKVDAIVMRFMDGLMSIPSLLLAIALMALLGGSIQNVLIAISVTDTPRAVRIVRASVLSLREQMFVDAAKAIGVPPWRILMLHIWPNTFAPLIVTGTFIAAAAVLTEANLSFLGAGADPETPSWGTVMADGRHYISRAVWITMIPGFFLTGLVLGVNLAGDGLRDNLDPKLRRRM